MQSEINTLNEKIEMLETELSDAQSKLRLSNKYADSLEQKINVVSKNNTLIFPAIVFLILIISLFVLKLKEK